MAFILPAGSQGGLVTGYVGTSATSGVVIRATTYTPQGTGAQRSVKSTSTLDAAAGTGARTITINYLDTSFNLKSETITLNGTTAVNTVNTDIAYLESIVVASVGSTGGNQGTISIFTTTAGGGSAWGSIAANDNKTFWAHHYVPAGVTCYPLSLVGGSTVTAGGLTINRSGDPSNANSPQLNVAGTYIHAGGNYVRHNFEVPIPIVGPDFIWLVERPTAITASTAYGTFEYIQF